jgi:uncharacterized repeat protein (TIGR01451 family)
LAPGATVTYKVTAQIDPTATGTLTNIATATPSGGTPASGSDSDTLTAQADLSVTKDDGKTTAVPGTPDTYTITVSNSGPSTASSFTLTDAEPAALLNPVFGTPSAGSYDPATGLWSGLSLGTGQSVTITLTGTIDPTATGTLTNTAMVSPPAGVTDLNPANNSATDTDTLTPQADLSVTKDDGKTTAVPGTSDTYTITVSNSGPSTVSSFTLTDPVPAALLNPVFGLPSAGSYDPATGVWSGLSLGTGQSVTITLTGTIDPTATGALTNTATVSPPAGVTDPNPTNNSATHTDTLTPQADLAVTKTDSVTSAVPGTTDSYTIVVSNNGPGVVTGASVSDPLPTGVTSATWAFAGATGGGVVSGPSSGSGALATTVNLPVNASVTFTFSAQIDPSATGILVNTATVSPPAGVTDPNPANDSATDSNSLTPQSDLSITKTDGLTSAVPGASTTYTVVVRNTGPSTAVNQAVSDLFPAALTGVSWTAAASAGSSVAAASGSGNIGTTVTLLPGGTVTFTAVAQISDAATGALTNTATVAVPQGDNTPGDNSATDTDSLTPQVGLSLTKTDSVTSAVPGLSTTYTITVSNAGPSDATGVTLSDPLPTGVTSATWAFVSAAGGGVVTGSSNGSGPLSTTVNLPAGASATFTFTAQIDPTATGSLTNIATSTPAPGEGTPASASDTNTLTPQADLAVTKTDGQTSAEPGTTDTYTITVSNSGPSTVSSFTLTDAEPTALLNPVFGTPSAGSYNPLTGLWSGLSLGTGQSVTITLTGTIDPTATGTLTNTAMVSPPAGATDLNPANNSATDTDTLAPQTDLSVSKTDGKTSAVPGATDTYTITVSNSGPSTVSSFTLSDAVPAALLNPVFGTPSAGSYNPLTGLWSGLSLGIGQSVTITLTGTIDPTATGTLTNIATVAPLAGVTDPNPGNNSASDTNTLTPQVDLAITKTDNVLTAVPGTTDSYTIVVSNTGPSVVTGATVSDPLPTGVNSATWTATASSGGGVVTGPSSGSGALATTVNLPVNASVTFTYTAQIDPSATGTLVNTATVSPPAGVTDPNPANNSATDSDTLTPQADLSITKTDGALAAVPGNSTTYTIVVSNAGPSTSVNQAVTDLFPAAVTSMNWTAVASAGSSVAAASGSGNIGTMVTLLPGGTVTFIAVAQISSSATGALINTATVAVPPGDNTPADNSAVDSDTLTPLANLLVTKTTSQTTAVPGTSTTYTIVVSNAGPSDATGVTLSDPLPTGVTADTWAFGSETGGGGVTGLLSGSGPLATTLNLPAGASVTFTFTAQIDPTDTGTLTNIATATAPGGTPASGSDTESLTPQADLSLTKTDGKTSAVPGTVDTYTITVSNGGPSTVSSFTLADPVPTALLNPVFGAPSAGSYNPATGLWSGLSLATGQSVTITLTGTIDPTATGTLTNTAMVSPPAGVTDPNPANNSAADTDTLTPQADLSLTKTDGKTSAVPGTSDTYTFTVTNNGPSTVSSFTLTDIVPATLHNLVLGTPSAGSYDPATGLWSGLSLGTGQSVTITLTGTIDPTATGTLTNTATVSPPSGMTDPNPANNSATDTDTLTPQGDLSITKTDSVTSAVPGTTDSYTMVVSNTGPSDVTGASVSDPVPAGVTSTTWTTTASSGGGMVTGPSNGSGPLATTVNLPVNASVTFTFSAQIDPSASGTLVNTATVSPPAGTTDPNPANNSATDSNSLTPQSDLSITKSDGVTSVVPGTTTTYTIVVSNAGPSTAVNQAVTDLFPAAVTSVSWTALASAGSSVAAASGSGNINTTVTLLPGGTVAFTAVAQISPAATGALTNTATVALPPGDITPADNSASDTDSLTPQFGLSVTKTDSQTTAVPGTSTTYTILVSNAGPSDATGVSLSDPLPTGVTSATWAFASESGGGSVTGPLSGSGALVTTANLPAGATVTFTFTAEIDSTATGTLTNTATATPPGGTPASGSNTESLTPQADLSVSKTDGKTSAVPGTPDTYTISVTNNGPSTVSSLTLTDAFPAALLNRVFGTPSAGSYDPLTGVWSGLSLATGQSVSITLTGTIDPNATGTLTNTTTVSPPTGVTDPNPANNSATDTDTLTPQADLAITKTDGVTSVIPGTSTTYTIVVSNTGPSAVTGATVSDPLPAGVTGGTWAFDAETGGGSVTGPSGGSGGLSTTVDLPVSASVTFIFTVQVSPFATGTLTNTATVSPPAGVTDPNPANDSATDTDALTPQADLGITKTDSITSAGPGTSTTYLIVVSNTGPSAVTGATVSDPLPTGVTSATWTATASSGGGSVTGASSGSDTLSTTVSLPVNASVTFTFTAQIDPSATGILVNTASVSPPAGVTDPNPSNNSASDSDTLTSEADLAITKTDSGGGSAVPGTNITYSISVANNGPSTVSGATVSDVLPAGTTFVSATNGATYDSGTNTVKYTTGTVASGGTTSFQLTLAISSGITGTLSNTATVSPPVGVTDPTPGNNSATDTDSLTPQVGLSVTKSDGKTTAVPGLSATYSIVVTNAGPSDATGVTLSDPLPIGVASATWAFAGETGGGSVSGSPSGSGPLSTTVNLPAGATITFSFTAQIDPKATGTLTNTATATPPPGEGTPASGSDSDKLTPQADLSVSKTDGKTSVVPGTAETYTITVTNNGPSTVSSLTLTDAGPAALLNPVYGTPSAGSYDSLTGLWSGLSLGTGQSVSITLTGTIDPTATGTLTNIATVRPPAGVTDPNGANNSSSDTDTLTPQADLAITKTDGVTSVVPGASTTYTIVVSNTGPSAVTGASVLDPLPAGTTGGTWTATASSGGGVVTGLSSGSGALSTTVNLPVNASVTFTFTTPIDPSATGSLTNTAMVTPPAGVTDLNGANNSATDADTLMPQSDLAITKTDGVTSAVPGGNTTYTIVVSNTGLSTAVDQAVTDSFPTAVTGVNWTAAASTGSSVATASGSGNIATTVTLLPGGTVTFTAVATINPSATGTLTNTATVAVPPGDSTPGDNSAPDSDTLTPQSDLAITKTDGVTSAVPGTNTVYTIVVSNAGPSTAVSQAVNDMFPLAITGVSWTALPSAGSSVAAASGNGNIATTVTLLPGGTVTFTAVATINPAATGTLTNTATVAVPQGDGTTGDNSATDTDNLTPQVGLSVTKTDSQTTAVPGTSTTYTIVVRNAGPSNATGVTLSDPLPLGVTSATWAFAGETGGGSVSGSPSGSGSLSTTVNLPAGATITFSFTAQIDPTATGTLTNTATATPPPGEGASASGSDSDTLTPKADLAVTKTVDNAMPMLGTPVTFTLTVTNHGPSIATNVVLADPLPDGVNLVSATLSQGTFMNPFWNVGTLANGASATLQITAVTAQVGLLVNNAAVGADQFDPNLLNNVAQAPITVLLSPPQIGKGLFLASTILDPPASPSGVVGSPAGSTVAPLNAALPFTDSFANPGDRPEMSPYWTDQFGAMIGINDQPMGVGDFNLATLNGISQVNSIVTAGVNLVDGEMAGLVARYGGPGYSNFYLGQLQGIGNGQFQAVIFVNVGGTFYPLAVGSTVHSGTGTLEFEVVGSSLKLLFNNQLVAYAQDASITTPGSVGMRLSLGATVTSFSANTAAAPIEQALAVTDANGDQELFGIGFDQALWVNSRTSPNGAFGGWHSLGGWVKQIAVGTNNNSTLEVFGIGADNAAWFRAQQAGSLSWSNWQSLGGYVGQLEVARDPNGNLDLFAIGATNGVWVNSQTTPAGSFGGWNSLGGWVKQITVGTNNNGTLQVFVIGADNAAWFRAQQAGSLSWSNWQTLGGYVQQLEVARDPNGNLELFAIGATNGVWVISQTTPAGSFGGWNSLGGWVKQITVGTNNNGTLQVFGIGADNAAWFRAQQAGSLSWSNWQSVGGDVQQLEVARDLNGTLALFGTGAPNGVWVNSQPTPADPFAGWSSLDGWVI